MTKEDEFIISVVKGDFNPCNVSADMDWSVVLAKMKKHKVLPYCYTVIKKYIPLSFLPIFDKEVSDLVDYQVKLLKALKEILTSSFDKQMFDLVLPKGFPLADMLYGDVFLRPSGDIDFLVLPKDISKLCDLLRKNGFFHRRDDRIDVLTGKLIENSFYNFYEIKFLKNYGGELIWAEAKIATDAIEETAIEPFIRESVPYFFDDVKINTLQNEYMFVHLCANAFKDTMGYEGIFTDVFRLRNFLDLKLFMEKYWRVMDWKKVVEISNKCNKFYTLQWALGCVKSIFYDDTVSEWEETIMKSAIGEIKNNPKFSEFLMNNAAAKKEKLHNLICDTMDNTSRRLASSGKMHIIFKNSKCELTLINAEKITLLVHPVSETERLYISLVKRPEYSEFPNEETLYSNAETFMLFLVGRTLKVQKKRFKTWGVNFAFNENIELLNNKIVDIELNNEGIGQLSIDEFGIRGDHTSELWFNAWIDDRVCHGYYRHKEYLAIPGEELVKLQR